MRFMILVLVSVVLAIEDRAFANDEQDSSGSNIQVTSSSEKPESSRVSGVPNVQPSSFYEELEFERVSGVESLADKITNGEAVNYPDIVKSAVVDFKNFLDDSRNKECSMESIERYEQLWSKYRYSDIPKEEDEEEPTRVVKIGSKFEFFYPSNFKFSRFLKHYGVQLGIACRLNMIKEIINHRFLVIIVEDLGFEYLLGPHGILKSALGFTPDNGIKTRLVSSDKGWVSFSETLLPSDILAMIKAPEYDRRARRFGLSVGSGSHLKIFKDTCSNLLQPFYSTLMMPVAKLANMGFRHVPHYVGSPGETLEYVRREIDDHKVEIGVWSNIVFLCEILSDIKVVVEKTVPDERSTKEFIQFFDPTEEESQTDKSFRQPTENEQLLSLRGIINDIVVAYYFGSDRRERVRPFNDFINATQLWHSHWDMAVRCVISDFARAHKSIEGALKNIDEKIRPVNSKDKIAGFMNQIMEDKLANSLPTVERWMLYVVAAAVGKIKAL